MRKRSAERYVSWIISAAFLVTVVRYSAAFAISDAGQITGVGSEVLTILMGLTGIGMGILDVLGGAFLFNGWRMTMPRTGQKWPFRFRILTFFVFGLIVSGIIILVPFTVSRIKHESIALTLGNGYGTWIWAFMVNIIPYFLIGGVFVGNKIIESSEITEVKKSEPETEKVSKKIPEISKRTDWRNLRPTLTEKDLDFFANVPNSELYRIASEFGVDPKTITNWRKYAQAELENKNEN